jgi:hypothetical protein
LREPSFRILMTQTGQFVKFQVLPANLQQRTGRSISLRKIDPEGKALEMVLSNTWCTTPPWLNSYPYSVTGADPRFESPSLFVLSILRIPFTWSIL